MTSCLRIPSSGNSTLSGRVSLTACDPNRRSLISLWLRPLLGLRAVALALRVGLAFAPLMFESPLIAALFSRFRAVALTLRARLHFALHAAFLPPVTLRGR